MHFHFLYHAQGPVPCLKLFNYSNGLFPLPDLDSDSDSDTDSCTVQDFSIGSDLDSDPLIEMYVIGTEIYP